MRRVLIFLAVFAGSAIAVYFAVLIGTTTVWRALGVHDQDGGGAMALAFVIGPAISLTAGLIIAIFAAVWSRKREALRASGALPPPSSRRKHVAILISGLAGYFGGYYATWIVYWLSGPLRVGSYSAALFLTWLPDIIGIACAFVAGLAAARAFRTAPAQNSERD